MPLTDAEINAIADAVSIRLVAVLRRPPLVAEIPADLLKRERAGEIEIGRRLDGTGYVAIQVKDLGLVRGQMVSEFSFDGAQLLSCVDAGLWERASNRNAYRYGRDNLLLRSHGVEIMENLRAD